MSDRVRLPLLAPEEFQSSLASDGHRRFVYAAEVHGRFHGLRRIVFALLVAIWIAVPLIPLNGHPLVLLDVQRRSFYFFGATFNSQDAWLAFFAITAVGWTLALSTSLLGRAFCGYACPQTVFLDGVFRPIERLVEGSREKRMRRDKGPWTWEKIGRKLLKHVLFAGAAFVIAHITLSFFVPLPQTLRMVVHSPAEHPEAFAWAAAVTLVTYGNFAFFREQLCLVICPYGRLQASLVDDDSLVTDADSVVESWMHIEIDRETDPADLHQIETTIQGVLGDVREAVEDWPRMLRQAATVADELAAQPPATVPAGEVDEAVDLLRWLIDDHFTFLGYREYVLDQ